MSRNTRVIVTLLVVTVFSFIAIASGDKSEDAAKKLATSTSDGNSNQDDAQASIVPIGTATVCGDFEVTIHSFNLRDRVNTGNMFSDLEPESGLKYAIVDIEFKNISSQAQLIEEGSLIIEPATEDPLVMDSSETILADGWGILLDNINPRITKRTKLVYKVPNEISGPIYYDPEMGDNILFRLGDK